MLASDVAQLNIDDVASDARIRALGGDHRCIGSREPVTPGTRYEWRLTIDGFHDEAWSVVFTTRRRWTQVEQDASV
jgi:hypothetical protein